MPEPRGELLMLLLGSYYMDPLWEIDDRDRILGKEKKDKYEENTKGEYSGTGNGSEDICNAQGSAKRGEAERKLKAEEKIETEEKVETERIEFVKAVGMDKKAEAGKETAAEKEIGTETKNTGKEKEPAEEMKQKNNGTQEEC
jgi:hypothetical protein